jgi:intein/homing endonuclease
MRIKTYRNKIYKDWFKTINDANTAYILGFFAADGCITKSRMSISISAQDCEILNAINNNYGIELPITEIAPRTNKQGISSQAMVQLNIYSQKAVEDIRELGFPFHKTYEGFNIPHMDKHLIWHFIRGYFDGDGSFAYTEKRRTTPPFYMNKCYSFSICSKTDTVLRDIQSYMAEYGIKSAINFDNIKKVFYLIVGGKNNIFLLKNNMYKDAEIFLKRKRAKFEAAPYNKKLIGIYTYKKTKFKATIKFNKINYFLGIFNDLSYATDIRDGAALLLEGFTARLNDEDNRSKPIDKEYLAKRIPI